MVDETRVWRKYTISFVVSMLSLYTSFESRRLCLPILHDFDSILLSCIFKYRWCETSLCAAFTSGLQKSLCYSTQIFLDVFCQSWYVGGNSQSLSRIWNKKNLLQLTSFYLKVRLLLFSYEFRRHVLHFASWHHICFAISQTVNVFL